MQRRTYVAGLGSALVAGLAGCSALGSNDDSGDDGTEDAELVNGSFEAGLDGWSVGTVLPPEPDEESGAVDHGISVLNGVASDGDAAVQFYVSGVADDGTIWVEQRVDLTDIAAIELDAYSEQQSFNEIAKVAFFAGEKPNDGLEETDFDRDEHVEDHEGWKTYTYDVEEVAGTATHAVGMNVIWETEVRRLFDHVRLVEADA